MGCQVVSGTFYGGFRYNSGSLRRDSGKFWEVFYGVSMIFIDIKGDQIVFGYEPGDF